MRHATSSALVLSALVALMGCKPSTGVSDVMDAAPPQTAAAATGGSPATLALGGVLPTSKPAAPSPATANGVPVNYFDVASQGSSPDDASRVCQANAVGAGVVYLTVSGPQKFSDGVLRYLCWGSTPGVFTTPQTLSDANVQPLQPVTPATASTTTTAPMVNFIDFYADGVSIDTAADACFDASLNYGVTFQNITGPVPFTDGKSRFLCFGTPGIDPLLAGATSVAATGPATPALPPATTPALTNYFDILAKPGETPDTAKAQCQSVAAYYNVQYQSVNGPVAFTDGFNRYLCYGLDLSAQ